MRYLDSSVVIAELFLESRRPPGEFWAGSLITSRLLEYEVWTKIHAKRLAESRGDQVRFLLERLAILEMEPPILARVLHPFPKPVRTLDAIHLASADFLRGQGEEISIATYDRRMRDTAAEMGFEVYEMG
ncbi:MAG TPA: PIN domain-containing protein [Gemmatimonadota bacterium]|nr:PIN domain-containing protein [Gemmatimonadota bacterium]